MDIPVELRGLFDKVQSGQGTPEENAQAEDLMGKLNVLALGNNTPVKLNDFQTGKGMNVEQINAKSDLGGYGTSGNKIVASKQANGVTSFTNVGTGPSTIQPVQPPTTNLVTEDPRGLNASIIKKQTDAIYAEKDEKVRMDMFSNLQQQYAQHEVIVGNDIRTAAENAVGLPQLRAKLEVSRRLDEQDRANNPALVGKESPMTMQLAAQVDMFTKEADTAFKRALNSNVSLVGMKAQMDTLVPMLNQAANRDIKNDAKLTTEKLKEDNLLAVTPPEAIDNWVKLHPADATKTPAQIAMAIESTKPTARTPEGKKLLDAIMTPKDDLVKTSLIDQNSKAYELGVLHEVETTGLARPIVEKRLQTARALMEDSNLFRQRVKEMYSGDKAKLDELIKLSNTTTTGTKDAQAQAKLDRFRAVTQIMSREATSDFENNVDKWGSVNADTPFGKQLKEAFTKVYSLGQPQSTQNVLKQLLGSETDPTRRSIILQEFRKVAEAEAKKSRGSSIAPVDIEGAKMRMVNVLAKPSVFSKFLDTAFHRNTPEEEAAQLAMMADTATAIPGLISALSVTRDIGNMASAIFGGTPANPDEVASLLNSEQQ